MEHKEEMVIDMQRLLKAVLDKMWLVLTAAALSSVIFLVGTLLLITPKYESSAMFYVNNNSLSVGEASFSITSSDITASKSLVDSYIVILQTRETLNDVIDYAGVERSVKDLREMISAEAVNATEIFEVVVTSPDPEEAESLAEAIAYILPKRISSIIEGTSAKVVDAAVLPVRPSSPSYLVNTILGFVFGLLLSVSVIVLMETLDIRIRGEEDITQLTKHPVLTAVPDMSAPSKGGYYSAYGKEKARQPKHGAAAKQQEMVGSQISFAASEAYKLLRAKLQFSFADVEGGRVIGISSALSGEGKSLTSVNLAYSLSELNKRVLLIDCDMRRPSISVKLPIARAPGLSNYLSGQVQLNDIPQLCNLKGEEDAFAVIAAGNNPPNPVELLSSGRMTRMLDQLRKMYDYIILDLPPVGEVSDAVASAKLTDGMLLVVRQEYCDRNVLSSAIRQFEFVEAKILGIVHNYANDGGSGKYYKRYYKKYGNRYESSYQAAAARTKKRAESRQKDGVEA